MKRITFFIGPNGCGKTRTLVNTAEKGFSSFGRSVAIANTPFVRFPRSRKNFQVFRVSPPEIKKLVQKNIENLFGDEGQGLFDVTALLKTIGFFPKVGLEIRLNESSDEALEKIDASQYDLEAIRSTLEILRSNSRHVFELIKSADSYERSISERNIITFKHLSQLKSIGIVSSFSLIFYHQERKAQIFNELSSGEQTLISVYLFIKSNLNDLRVVYIDEPENSLHPEWQRRFIKMLHIAIGYNETELFLATHSPVLVSGSVSDYGDEVEIVRIDGKIQRAIEIGYREKPESVEEILWKAFDTITPVSHYLSIELSHILNEYTAGRLQQEEAEMKIKKFQDHSYDKTQKNLLDAVLNRLSEFAPNA